VVTGSAFLPKSEVSPPVNDCNWISRKKQVLVSELWRFLTQEYKYTVHAALDPTLD
jgi:hypothetical protein